MSSKILRIRGNISEFARLCRYQLDVYDSVRFGHGVYKTGIEHEITVIEIYDFDISGV